MTAAITPPIESATSSLQGSQTLRLIDGDNQPAHWPALPSLRAVAAIPQLAPVNDEPQDNELATVHRLPVRQSAAVYRQRRLMVASVLVALLLGVVSMLSQPSSTGSPVVGPDETVTVVVSPGDTLWGIASEVNPNGNTRALVTRLADLAGSTTLQVGQTLTIPGSWLS